MEQAQPARPGPGQPTVLVVEDEPHLLDVVADELEDAGFATIRAPDGRAALDALAGPGAISVLFTDIRLPGGMDGWSLAEKARALRPSLPVIYATGYTHDPPRKVPGGLFFLKPYRLAEIVQAVRGFA